MQVTRREAVMALGLIGSTGIISATATAKGEAKTSAASKHTRVPLPFDPKRLNGLSERLIVSHHENNYGGAVENLNKVEAELGRVNKNTPGFIVGGLKERELVFTNSVILHELYFGNLGGSGKATGTIHTAIANHFGSLGRWEELFRATGMSLAGGSGWVILDLNLHSGELGTCWSGNHSQALAFSVPVLVMDMYEHAYQLDYGAAAAKYIDAFFANVRWEAVNRRYERAQQAAAALRA
jgi:Fe-Mn family superoxide dismutase